MEIFLASANLDEIKKAYSLPIAGVLTNSSIIQKEKMKLTELVKGIDEIGNLPFGLQIAATEEHQMMEETRLFLSMLHHRVLHLKIPYCPDAFKIIPKLQHTDMILNLTGVSSLAQAWLKKIKQFADYNKKPTRIVAASIRNIDHLEEVALAGADAVAIPYPLLLKAMESEVTQQSITGFKKDWQTVDIG